MQTYLYLFKRETATPQEQYLGKYLLKHVDYDFFRAASRKGEITSDVQGGEIRVVIDGFADAALAGWIFSPYKKESGVIVTRDEEENPVTLLQFSDASLSNFRLNYDSRVKEGLATLLTIKAGEITTDNDLYFQNR